MPDPSTSLRVVRGVAADQDGVVTRRQVLDAGVSDALARTLLASGSWVRLLRGTYLVEPERSRSEQQPSWARSGVLLVPGAVASHHTAAVLHGIRGLPRTGAVHVTRTAKAMTRPRLQVYRNALAGDDVVELGGLLVTSPQRTLTDLVPTLDRLHATAVLDSALFRRVATRSELDAAREATRGRRGCLATDDVWDTADERAQSPLESRMRVRSTDAGIPPDALQVPVLDRRGVRIAVADASFDPARVASVVGLPPPPPGLRMLAEADGQRFHGEGDDEDANERVFVWDRRRQNAVTALGYTVVRFTWADTQSRGAVPAALKAQLLERLAA